MANGIQKRAKEQDRRPKSGFGAFLGPLEPPPSCEFARDMSEIGEQPPGDAQTLTKKSQSHASAQLKVSRHDDDDATDNGKATFNRYFSICLSGWMERRIVVKLGLKSFTALYSLWRVGIEPRAFRMRKMWRPIHHQAAGRHLSLKGQLVSFRAVSSFKSIHASRAVPATLAVSED